MRYKVILKQCKPPYRIKLRLENGQEKWIERDAVTNRFSVGDTGKLHAATSHLAGTRRRFTVDAIDV